MDEIIVNEGVTQGWMQVPLSPREVVILKSLPEEGKHEFTENVHRYIETVGDDYKVLPPADAVPAQEPAGVIVESTDGGGTFHVILPPELSPSITSMVLGRFGVISPPEPTVNGWVVRYEENEWSVQQEEEAAEGMTEEEMERVISVLKTLPEINIEEVLRSSTPYSEGEKR